MKAIIKSFDSPNTEDLPTWQPDNSKFVLPIQLIIGPDDSLGEESFDLTICTAD